MARFPLVACFAFACSALPAEDAGAIHVQAEPGLQVWLDRLHRGMTKGTDGFRLEGIEPGRHLLKVVSLGLQPRVTWIEVKPGEVASYEPHGFEPPIVSRSADDLVFRDDDRNTARLAVELLPMNCRVDCDTLDIHEFETGGGCWVLEGIPAGEHRFRFYHGPSSVEYVGDFTAGKEVTLRVDPAAGTVVQDRGSARVGLKEMCHRRIGAGWSFVGFSADGERFWSLDPGRLDVYSARDGAWVERPRVEDRDVLERAIFVTGAAEKILSLPRNPRLTDPGERNRRRAAQPLRRFDVSSGTKDAVGAVELDPGWEDWDASHDAGLVAQWCFDRIEVWNLDHGTRLWEARSRTATSVPGSVLAFSTDDRFLLTAGGADRKLQVYDARTGKWLTWAPFRREVPLRILPAGDGEHAAILCRSGRLVIWSPSSNSILGTIPADATAANLVEPYSFPPALSSKGLLLLAAGPEGRLELWDYRTGRRLRTLPDPVEDGGRAVFSPDGGRLLVAEKAGMGRVTVYEIER